MTEFWEESFADKQEMWGLEAAASAVLANKLFLEKSIKKVLIPGIGYGRNAQPFVDSGMQVTGIEISKTAIELSQKHYGTDMTIYHGSVTDMPFDDEEYDGIFCYGLIHLLDQSERAKLISDCYNQLAENGYMVFTAITKNAQTYGKGTYLSKDRFEMFGGVKMFFYDKETIKKEFEDSELVDIVEIEENYPFYMIICKKGKA